MSERVVLLPKAAEDKKVEPAKVVKKPRPVFDSLKRSYEPAVVTFSDKAMAKMLSLIMLCDKEVGWHGSGRRIETGKYLIDDVYIYPQKTTAATINIDDDGYAKWMMSECMEHEERAESRCFHGHSHVNMAASPSGVDRDYQDDTIEMVQEDGFYIFAIINKRLNVWFKIVDRVDNVYYETAYHNITINTESNGLQEIAKDYEGNVTESTAGYYYGNKNKTGGNYYGGYQGGYGRTNSYWEDYYGGWH